jgi:hypothetical protein
MASLIATQPLGFITACSAAYRAVARRLIAFLPASRMRDPPKISAHFARVLAAALQIRGRPQDGETLRHHPIACLHAGDCRADLKRGFCARPAPARR